MKKLVGLLLILTMTLGLSMTVWASNSPELKLEKNQYNSNRERHIKVTPLYKGGVK